MSEIRFIAAGHVISLRSESEAVLRYFRWKTALLAADGIPADIRVCILIEDQPEGEP